MATQNRQITLAARPSGFPKESDFQLVNNFVSEPGPYEALARTLWLSVDPYMRGRMTETKSYAAPMKVGEVMVGGAVSEVVKSNDDSLKPGDIVVGMTGWQDYAVAKASELHRVDESLGPISTALGVLGAVGMTAYFGLLDICDPKHGETAVVSGAAGAVGSLAAQIAKIRGCRVVGIAGADEKIDYLINDLGLDAAFNYKTTADYNAKIRELCPAGVDVYFDNVGGAITDAAMMNMNVHARISICGQIALYNLERPEMGPRLLPLLIIKRAKVQGFLVLDYMQRFGEGIRQMAAWLREGKLTYRETIVEGLENAPAAFIGMLRGGNTGKQLVKVAGR